MRDKHRKPMFLRLLLAPPGKRGAIGTAHFTTRGISIPRRRQQFGRTHEHYAFKAVFEFQSTPSRLDRTEKTNRITLRIFPAPRG